MIPPLRASAHPHASLDVPLLEHTGKGQPSCSKQKKVPQCKLHWKLLELAPCLAAAGKRRKCQEGEGTHPHPHAFPPLVAPTREAARSYAFQRIQPGDVQLPWKPSELEASLTVAAKGDKATVKRIPHFPIAFSCVCCTHQAQPQLQWVPGESAIMAHSSVCCRRVGHRQHVLAVERYGSNAGTLKCSEEKKNGILHSTTLCRCAQN